MNKSIAILQTRETMLKYNKRFFVFSLPKRCRQFAWSQFTKTEFFPVIMSNGFSSRTMINIPLSKHDRFRVNCNSRATVYTRFSSRNCIEVEMDVESIRAIPKVDWVLPLKSVFISRTFYYDVLFQSLVN